MERAIRAVLPTGARVDLGALEGQVASVVTDFGGFTARWVGEGWLRNVADVLSDLDRRPLVIVARRMSPGAQAASAGAGVSWLDESGAAEIALPGLLISRSGRPDPKRPRTPRWTGSTIGTAEALLLGTRPTVSEVERATGLSAGSATTALSALTALGHLRSDAARGRGSARQIVDRARLLDAYAEAATAREAGPSLRVGVSGRDLLDEVRRLGDQWDADKLGWAVTGAAAAAVLGPYLTEVPGLDVLIDAPTPATLDAAVDRAGLRPMEGGRLLLRPFPTLVTARLSTRQSGLRLAPWPRVYADLRISGVRGEEAAEHLRDVIESG